MTPRRKEKKGVIKWPKQETSRLIASIKAQLKKHDSLSYSQRIKVLNWEKICIPHKSIKECRGHLDAVIKKIHRIRTLEEILSDVEVEPIDVVGEQMGGEMSKSNVATDNNKNILPATPCLQRKSKRLSEANASGDEETKIVLTDDEHVLLQKDRQDKGETVDPGSENNASIKRTRDTEANDDATHLQPRKIQRLEKTPADCSTGEMIEETKLIRIKSAAQEVAAVNESINRTNEIDQICSSSASDMEMERSDTEISLFNDEFLAVEPTVSATNDLLTENVQLSCDSLTNNMDNYLTQIDSYIEPEEELKIELLQVSDNTSSATTEHFETSVQSEDESKVDGFENNVVLKEGVTESPRIFSRIRTFLTGLFGRKK